MKSVARIELIPGMELAENVYTYHGELLFPENTILDISMINKLARYSIMCVSIKEKVDYATTHYEKIHLTKRYQDFEKVYRNNLNAYKYMTDEFLQTGVIMNQNYLLQIHDNIRSCVTTGEELLMLLYYMQPSEDDLTYAHCLNAALICNVFSNWLGMSDEASKTLTLCGFYYDIGKLKLPNDLLWTPGRLSNEEYTKMQTHTLLGYELIRNKQIDLHIINAALMHHERNDGSGYPNHLIDDEIDLYAKIIAIVDTYEAMTSARTYRSSMNPFQVIQTFEESGFGRYESAILRPILEHIAKSQMGRRVVLSNQVIADVMLINNHFLSHPLVKAVENDQLIDLQYYKEISILSFI